MKGKLMVIILLLAACFGLCGCSGICKETIKYPEELPHTLTETTIKETVYWEDVLIETFE